MRCRSSPCLRLTVGLMLGIQFIAALSEFGAQSQVVIAVAKSVTREFGALITAILVAGRSGSALAARIGSMTVSQEVDALAVIGIEPVRYLVAPALIAMLIMLPALTIFAERGRDFRRRACTAHPRSTSRRRAYLLQTLSLLSPGDLWQGLAKSVVFAVLITLIGVSTGFSVTGGAEGVGRATTRAVVLSICWIIVADMIFRFSSIDDDAGRLQTSSVRRKPGSRVIPIAKANVGSAVAGMTHRRDRHGDVRTQR